MRSVLGTTSLGSTDEDAKKGLYTWTASVWDQTLWDYPYYIHFYAAGNDRNSFSSISTDRPIAKNTLTIGSVKNVVRDADGSFVSGGQIFGFSSHGPTDDGRIKPD